MIIAFLDEPHDLTLPTLKIWNIGSPQLLPSAKKQIINKARIQEKSGLKSGEEPNIQEKKREVEKQRKYNETA